ncbi:MAG: glycosyltransferase [Deltaproteobacteria bacterium]|nr:glycosyltransferase [Deltaproteobacteria bacterium]
MRVLLAAFGTRGDVQPMLALARGLKRAGHTVTFCMPPDHAAWVEKDGFVVVACGPAYSELLHELTQGLGRAFRALAAQIPAQFNALDKLVDDADIVIAASLEYATTTLCEQKGKPRRYVTYSTCALWSSSNPIPPLAMFTPPRFINALTWKLAALASRFTVLKPIELERRARGLPPIASIWSYTGAGGVLLPFAASLADTPPTHEPIAQTGPWLLDDDHVMPDDVDAFLRAGSPPVYVGFGSMLDHSPAQTRSMVRAAAIAADVRVLFAGPRSDDSHVDDDAFFVSHGPLPHRAIFPRCAGVVHHGGAGTTTVATLSGVPQLVVPHEVDQFFHGRRIEALGLGPRAIFRRKLTAANLAPALRSLVSGEFNPACRAHAPRIPADGVDVAVRLIEAAAGQLLPQAGREGARALLG